MSRSDSRYDPARMSPDAPPRWKFSLPRALALASSLALAPFAGAQELEPRAFSPAPVGVNFFVASYGYQQGEVLFDPSLPFSDVKAYLNGATLGYGRSLGLFGRLSSLSVAVIVAAPTGQYSPGKLINIGTNRWAFKAEVGASYPVGAWTFEATVGSWLFTPNTEFYPGAVERTQEPLASVQGHVGYTFQPGLWLAVDATYSTGGLTSSNGVPGELRQSNSRAGATLSLPLSRGHSIKLVAATGVSARVGSRFNTYAIA